MFSRCDLSFDIWNILKEGGKFGISARVSPENVSFFFRGRGPLTRGERSFFFSRYTQSSLFL